MMHLRHMFEAVLGTAVAALIYLAVFAQPLHVETTEVIPGALQRGAEFKISHVASKPWWSVQICRATAGHIHIVDADGARYRQDAPFGYNDGSITEVKNRVTVPENAAYGDAEAYESVNYTCLGIVPRTVYTPRAPFQIVGLKQHDEAD